VLVVDSAITDTDMGRLLAGRWRVAASTVPWWSLDGRRSPEIEYSTLHSAPLRLRGVARYRSADGGAHQLEGIDEYRRGEFVWHGRGVRRLTPTRWRLTGISESAKVVVLQRDRSLGFAGGIDVLQRPDTRADARALVAGEASNYGIGLEQFASLSWFSRP
jgi:hypothetical protein